MSVPREMIADGVSDESDDQLVTEDELYNRVKSLEEDNAVLRAMLQRDAQNVQHMAQLPKERLAVSIDKATAELRRERDRRQGLERLRAEDLSKFEVEYARKAQECRHAQDTLLALRAELDGYKARCKSYEMVVEGLKKDNADLRYENDKMVHAARKANKAADPMAQFTGRGGRAMPFSQVLKRLSVDNVTKAPPSQQQQQRASSRGGVAGGRSASTSHHQNAEQQQEYRFVDPNNAEQQQQQQLHRGGNHRSISPYQNPATTGNAAAMHGGSTGRSRSINQNPLDIREGARVTWNCRQAIIRYLGPVDGLSYGDWAGLELVDGSMGDHGGSFGGRQYYACSRRTGVFCKPGELSAPRLLDQYPAEQPPQQAATGRSASTNSARYQQPRSSSAHQQPGTGRSISSQPHQQRQPAGPRIVTRAEFKAQQEKVDALRQQASDIAAQIAPLAAEESYASVRSMLNLVAPAELVQKCVGAACALLHQHLNRDQVTAAAAAAAAATSASSSTTTGGAGGGHQSARSASPLDDANVGKPSPRHFKDVWERNRNPTQLVGASRVGRQLNGETAEFLSVYNVEDFTEEKAARCGGSCAAGFYRYVRANKEVARLVLEMVHAETELRNMRVIEKGGDDGDDDAADQGGEGNAAAAADAQNEQQEEAAAAPAPAAVADEGDGEGEEKPAETEEEEQKGDAAAAAAVTAPVAGTASSPASDAPATGDGDDAKKGDAAAAAAAPSATTQIEDGECLKSQPDDGVAAAVVAARAQQQEEQQQQQNSAESAEEKKPEETVPAADSGAEVADAESGLKNDAPPVAPVAAEEENKKEDAPAPAAADDADKKPEGEGAAPAPAPAPGAAPEADVADKKAADEPKKDEEAPAVVATA